MPPINPVSASAGGGASAAQGAPSSLGRDDFLLLLVTQLRYQDPLNPLQAQDFASQLAEFTAMEQQLRTNELLEAQEARDESRLLEARESMALGLIGRTVLTEGDTLEVVGDAPPAAYVRMEGPAAIRIEVLGAGGEPLLAVPYVAATAGTHRIDLGEAGAALPPGSYRVRVTSDSGVEVSAMAAQVVLGVRFEPSGPVVLTGSGPVALSDVHQINLNP